MSGSGGGGGNRNGVDLNCATVSFTTTLASVQSDALQKVQVGDRLRVDIDDGKVVVVVPASGKLVGSINWAQNSKLVSCMEDGYEYAATVREIDDGMVKVHVTTV